MPAKKLFYRFLPQIDRSEVIRVPKLDTIIDLKSIFELPVFADYKSLDHSDKLGEVQVIDEESVSESFNCDTFSQIRVLSMQYPSKESDEMYEKDTLLVHIHGGGFITMSSGSYMMYTRTWAQQNPRAVICSLEYQLAPGARWPDQIDDVW